MKSRFRIYADILQLRTPAFEALKYANGGMRYTVSMFIVVSLIAGAGLWVGLPALMQKPLLVEQLDEVSAFIDRVDAEVAPEINASLDALSRENLSIALADLLPEQGAVTVEKMSAFADQVDLNTAQLADTLTAEAANLTGEVRTKVEAQAESLRQDADATETVTAAQIEQLMAQTPLTEQHVADLLAQAATAQSRLDRLRTQATQQTPQIEQLLGQISLSPPQFRNLLTRLLLTPERLSNLTLQVGLTSEQLTAVRANIDALPEAANAVVADVRAEVERFHPPLGVRFSRFSHMFGEWISTPLALLARWAFFALFLLVMAKLLGGTGTLRQHMIAVLLTSAPLFLLFFTYVPNVVPALPSSFNLAFDYFGRILALVGMAWAFLILLKSMSVTHEFGMWRSLGIVALTWSAIYVILPFLSFLAMGYILRG